MAGGFLVLPGLRFHFAIRRRCQRDVIESGVAGRQVPMGVGRRSISPMHRPAATVDDIGPHRHVISRNIIFPGLALFGRFRRAELRLRNIEVPGRVPRLGAGVGCHCHLAGGKSDGCYRRGQGFEVGHRVPPVWTRPVTAQDSSGRQRN